MKKFDFQNKYLGYLGDIDNEKFYLCMYRKGDGYQGDLTIYDEKGKIIHTSEKEIAFAGRAGFDAGDVDRWFNYAIDWVDNNVYKFTKEEQRQHEKKMKEQFSAKKGE